jgi:hypothetical protein
MSKARMFSKLVERCIDCPNLGERNYPVTDDSNEPFCIETNKDLKPDNLTEFAIPKWCPLSIAPPE